MFLKKFFFLVALFSLILIGSVQGHEKKWPEKRLRQVWTQAQSFSSKQISLSPSQISTLNAEGVKIGSEDRSPTFYFAQEKIPSSDKAKTIGVILFIDEYGANGLMEISVAMNPEGTINKIDLWEHSENSAVAKNEFLSQFTGKSAKDSFITNKDYHPAPESLKASEAVAKAALKALKITNVIFMKK